MNIKEKPMKMDCVLLDYIDSGEEVLLSDIRHQEEMESWKGCSAPGPDAVFLRLLAMVCAMQQEVED